MVTWHFQPEIILCQIPQTSANSRLLMSGRHLVDNATYLETSDFSAYIVKNIQINLYSMTEINNGTFIFIGKST